MSNDVVQQARNLTDHGAFDDRQSTAPTGLPSGARLRSGTAARLAGLPVTTLRVWERRYAVVAAPKTATGQRLYGAGDVARLRLLRQLTDHGHAIGTIAMLDLPALQALADNESESRPAAPARGDPAATAQRVVVIGRSAAQKWAGAGGVPHAVFDDLDAARAALAAPAAAAEALGAVLLVHLPSLHPAQADQALDLAAALSARPLVVLYAYAAGAVLDRLRSAGALLRREPASGRDLRRLLAPLVGADDPAAALASAARGTAPTRRFSDVALAHFAEQPNLVECECPRHLAEIVSQLVSFERYSADCTSRSPQDAALHRHLSGLTSAARALFEQALERVAIEEGLVPPAAA